MTCPYKREHPISWLLYSLLFFDSPLGLLGEPCFYFHHYFMAGSVSSSFVFGLTCVANAESILTQHPPWQSTLPLILWMSESNQTECSCRFVLRVLPGADEAILCECSTNITQTIPPTLSYFLFSQAPTLFTVYFPDCRVRASSCLISCQSNNSVSETCEKRGEWDKHHTLNPRSSASRTC